MNQSLLRRNQRAPIYHSPTLSLWYEPITTTKKPKGSYIPQSYTKPLVWTNHYYKETKGLLYTTVLHLAFGMNQSLLQRNQRAPIYHSPTLKAFGMNQSLLQRNQRAPIYHSPTLSLWYEAITTTKKPKGSYIPQSYTKPLVWSNHYYKETKGLLYTTVLH